MRGELGRCGRAAAEGGGEPLALGKAELVAGLAVVHCAHICAVPATALLALVGGAG